MSVNGSFPRTRTDRMQVGLGPLAFVSGRRPAGRGSVPQDNPTTRQLERSATVNSELLRIIESIHL
ncbi:MAG TPA: hypothetical protein VK824_05175, partial [Planctomycetota bacterium]|nr:hypothetical protein [Planctomycetota bacterium]